MTVQISLLYALLQMLVNWVQGSVVPVNGRVLRIYIKEIFPNMVNQLTKLTWFILCYNCRILLDIITIRTPPSNTQKILQKKLEKIN